ncbi:NAD(P)H-binding protein, partial [Streptomyces halstedii]|uniref:NAD(P)H-binding protein n=1 Tax=Streptomyces halstedii TaxID=1944 RepID=UPI003F4C6C43
MVGAPDPGVVDDHVVAVDDDAGGRLARAGAADADVDVLDGGGVGGVVGRGVGKRVAQHTALIEAARAAGVAQLAYTGVLGGPDADFTLADEHKTTEQLILDSGLPYTFLRNGWYTENYTANLAPVLEHGAVVTNAGEGRIASASRADFAAAASAVLTGEGHLGQAYELSGDTAWSLAEYAA